MQAACARTVVFGDVAREQVGRRVREREELRDVVRADEDFGVVLLDALDPSVLDDAGLITDHVLPDDPRDVHH